MGNRDQRAHPGPSLPPSAAYLPPTSPPVPALFCLFPQLPFLELCDVSITPHPQVHSFNLFFINSEAAKAKSHSKTFCRSSYLISEQFCVRGTMISPFYRWRDRGTGQVKGSAQVPQIPGIHPGSLAPEKGVDPPPCSFGAA